MAFMDNKVAECLTANEDRLLRDIKQRFPALTEIHFDRENNAPSGKHEVIFKGKKFSVKEALMMLFHQLSKRFGVNLPQIRDVAQNILLDERDKPEIREIGPVPVLTPISHHSSQTSGDGEEYAETPGSKSFPRKVVVKSESEDDEKETIKQNTVIVDHKKCKEDFRDLQWKSKEMLKKKNERIKSLNEKIASLEEQNKLAGEEEKLKLSKEQEDKIQELETKNMAMELENSNLKLSTEETNGKLVKAMDQVSVFFKENKELKEKIKMLERSGSGLNCEVPVPNVAPVTPVKVEPGAETEDMVELRKQLASTKKNLSQLERKYIQKKQIIGLRDGEIRLLNDEVKDLKMQVCRSNAADEGIMILN